MSLTQRSPRRSGEDGTLQRRRGVAGLSLRLSLSDWLRSLASADGKLPSFPISISLIISFRANEKKSALWTEFIGAIEIRLRKMSRGYDIFPSHEYSFEKAYNKVHREFKKEYL